MTARRSREYQCYRRGEPAPCDDCPYHTHCGTSGAECLAYRCYVIGRDDWAGIAREPRGCAVDDNERAGR